jgi:hypothetical protein
MSSLQSFTLRSDTPDALEVNLGEAGGTITFEGTSLAGTTVYYRDEPNVTAATSDGSLTSGSSVTLYGTQWFAIPYDKITAPPPSAALTVTLPQLTGSPSQVAHLPLNVRDATYGTKVNGGGDAVSGILACLQDANAAVDSGVSGVDIYVPRGDYTLTAYQTGNGQNWHLPIERSGIRFIFEQGARFITTQDAALLFFSGASRPATAANWGTYWLGLPTARTYYPFTAALARGDVSFTLSNLADAAHFAVGDAIHIRTGNTTNANVLSTEPDAEINEVASISGAVIGLRWPLVKDYQQEWYVGAANGGLDSNAGKTDTTNRGGANHGAATFGVANIQAITMRNVGVENFQFDAPNAGRYGIMAFGAIIGLDILGAGGRIGGSVMNAIEYRFARMRDFDVEITNTASGSARWITTTATSCSDVVMESIRGVGKGGRMAMAHFHEGTANLKVNGYDLVTDAGQDDITPYDIRGRAYNQHHENVSVVSGGSLSPVYVSPECGDPYGLSSLRKVRAKCSDATKGIRVEAAGWSVRDSDPATPLRLARPGGGFTVASTTTGATAAAVPQEVLRYTAWVDVNNKTVVLGQIPDNTTVWDAALYVQQAFDSDGTDRVTVGWDGVTEAIVKSAAMSDVATTGDRPILFGDYFRQYQGPTLTQPRTLKAYYVAGGSAPTQGKVRVTVLLHRDPEAP